MYLVYNTLNVITNYKYDIPNCFKLSITTYVAIRTMYLDLIVT